MKPQKPKLNWQGKVIWYSNWLFTTILFLSFSAQYIDPREGIYLALMGLSFPIWLLFNLAFMTYWMVKIRVHFLLSFLGIILVLPHINSLYRLQSKQKVENGDRNIKIMTYNVRMFNSYEWLKETNITDSIFNLIEIIQADVLCIQEFHATKKNQPRIQFPYSYIRYTNSSKSYGLALYSRFEIIDTGFVSYPDFIDLGTNTGFMWADLIIEKDTVRIVNVHLASLKLQKSDFDLVEDPKLDDSETLKKSVKAMGGRIGSAFEKRGYQLFSIKKILENSPHPIILCGDFNDTHSSYAYKTVKKRLNDTYTEAGKGFSATYSEFAYPLRIDYIFTDVKFQVMNHHALRKHYSDHFPVIAEIKMPD